MSKLCYTYLIDKKKYFIPIKKNSNIKTFPILQVNNFDFLNKKYEKLQLPIKKYINQYT